MCLSNSQTFRFIIWLKNVYNKYSLGHFILIISYLLFILLSAGIFYLAESKHSDKLRKTWNRQLADERNSFILESIIPQIFNNTKLFLYVHNQKSQYLTQILNNRLADYEGLVKLRPPMPTMPCTLENSILFVFSTITTIGYGYIYPVTDRGRMLSIIISILGIPFTIVVIKDLSYLLAKGMHLPCFLLDKVWATFRFCTLRPVDEYELERKLQDRRKINEDYRIHETERLLAIPISVAVFSVIGWVACGCFIVRHYIPSISYSAAVYFIFNSLTTTGVGEVEYPDNTWAQVTLFLFIIIGITLISLFVNLINTKLCRAYWLPGKMYIPLRTNISCAKMESFDSLREMTLDDYPFNHFTTLGVIHTDDKRGLMTITRKEKGLIEAQTQTATINKGSISQPPRLASPSLVTLPYPTTSKEDVNDLLIETYSRPLNK